MYIKLIWNKRSIRWKYSWKCYAEDLKVFIHFIDDKIDLDKEIIKIISRIEVLLEWIKIKRWSEYRETRLISKYSEKVVKKNWIGAASILNVRVIGIWTLLLADIKTLLCGENHMSIEAEGNNG